MQSNTLVQLGRRIVDIVVSTIFDGQCLLFLEISRYYLLASYSIRVSYKADAFMASIYSPLSLTGVEMEAINCGIDRLSVGLLLT